MPPPVRQFLHDPEPAPTIVTIAAQAWPRRLGVGVPDGQPQSLVGPLRWRRPQAAVFRTILHAVIHEAALHMHFGGPEVMRNQLVHLIELARQPTITIQVFPFKADAFAAFSGAFLHVTPSVPELSTVLLEHPVKSIYLDDEEHITQYQAMFDRLSREALAPINPTAVPESHAHPDSLGLLQHILYTL